jgi:GntR family transcriptional regulator
VIPFRVVFQPGASLYEQVVYAAKKALVSGQLRPGDAFPSVRTLSAELKINPNTAHKVITQLLNEGGYWGSMERKTGLRSRELCRLP